MTKVFISGSRSISRLNSKVIQRLDNIVHLDLPVLVGDANGVDRAVQRYLFSRGFDPVEVYCSGSACRNNVGGWSTRHIAVRARSRGAEFFYAKDRVMASEATVGLMIWNGESTGTPLNILRMVQDGKMAVLFSVIDDDFLEIRSLSDWHRFLSSQSADLQREIERRVFLEPCMRHIQGDLLSADRVAAT